MYDCKGRELTHSTFPGRQPPQLHSGPLGITAPKGPSGSGLRTFPAGISPPHDQSQGNPCHPCKTLPRKGG